MSANPEIHLSQPPPDYVNEKVRNDDDKKSPDGSTNLSPTRTLSSSDELVYHYLEFDTPIPRPSYLSAPYQFHSTPPPEPDLKKYESPFKWSKSRKRAITWLSCLATTVTAYAAGSYTAGDAQMEQEWGVSRVAITVGVTIFTTGFAIAPMILAPFSEINGRRPMFVVTGILYVILQVCCAVTRSYGGMLAARFFKGCASSTFSTMVGGVISDIYHAEDRNTAMALFSGAALFGTGLGPLVSSFIAYYTTWRWIFYLQVITCGIVQVMVLLFFKESRGSVLLSKKAKCLNKYYDKLEAAGFTGVDMPSDSVSGKTSSQRIRWKVKSDEERASLLQMIRISLIRPFHLLFTEPVVFFFSLWVAFSWAILYLTFGAIPVIFSASHNFNLYQIGSVFAAISIASIISTIISILGDKWTKRRFPHLGDSPEGRLYFACAQSILLPVGLFWLAWTSGSNVHWIVPTLAIGCATMGIFSIYLAVFNYLADTYHRYASSALAAQSFCRNMLGGAFPLFVPQMFRAMTFQGAGSLLGGIGAVLTLVPFALLIWGPKIRARSKFASEIMDK
ncbi:MFS multidrug transporter-like protein, partial [Aureobasidium melanogenum]